MTIHTNCKFCKGPVTAIAGPDCPELHLDAWKPLICCNRCGSFREWLRRVETRVKKICWDWATKPQKQREQERAGAYGQLEEATRNIAGVVCKFYRVGFTWDKDFVEQLLERPDKAEFTIKAYENIVRREAISRHQPAVVRDGHQQ